VTHPAGDVWRRQLESRSPTADAALGCAPCQHAAQVVPERLGQRVAQITAREPDIGEHSIIVFDQAPELAAMLDGNNEVPRASQQRCSGMADQSERLGGKVRSRRDP